jgi:predicted Co/Zn/Cd cation transporter (cation efflux family)
VSEGVGGGGYSNVIWGVYAVWSVLLAALSLWVTLTYCPQAAGGGE